MTRMINWLSSGRCKPRTGLPIGRDGDAASKTLGSSATTIATGAAAIARLENGYCSSCPLSASQLRHGCRNSAAIQWLSSGCALTKSP